MSTASVVVAALPLVYSIGSAVALLYLARKPVHLDQISAIDDQLANDPSLHDESNGSGDSDETRDLNASVYQSGAAFTDTTAIDQVQTLYQEERANNIGVNLARFGFTALQLGLTLFSLELLRSSNNSSRQHHGQNLLLDDSPTQAEYHSFFGYLVQILTWTYALALAFVQATRPAVAAQFWIRPQMDLFYTLEFFLQTYGLLRIDFLTVPLNELPFWLKLDGLTWTTVVLLLGVSLTTRPYRPQTPPKKLLEGEVARLPSREYASSIYSRLTFSWVNPLVYLGYKRSLQEEDLPDIEPTDQSLNSIKRYNRVKQESLFRSLVKTFRGQFLIQFVWAMPWCLLINVSPYLLNKIIIYVECETCGPPTSTEYLYVVALFATSVAESLCHQTALQIGRRIFAQTASICNSQVFAKSLRRRDMASPAEKSDENKDEKKKDGTLNIANLIAVDVKKMEIPFSYLHYLYGFPIQFVFAGVQLYWLLGYASLVGIACMFITYPIPAKLYSMIMSLFKDIMSTKDDRMDALNEMLSAIRIVKFFGWESKFEEKITAAREIELNRTKESYIKIILTDIVWMVVPLLNIVVILTTYTKIFGHDISASKIFTTLALFNIMRSALNSLPWQIKNTMQAVVSIGRINKFLLEEELLKDTTVTKIDGKANVNAEPVIGFADASFVWHNKEQSSESSQSTKADETKKSLFQRIKAKFSKKTAQTTPEEPVAEVAEIQERFMLKDLNVKFPIGKLSVIAGPTGSGKSAMLLALLGELEKQKGHMYMPRRDYGPYASASSKENGSGIAYVSQTAWLQNSTIRKNILFGCEFDQERYDAVIEGCALTTDFDIFDAGDLTEIGEQGITLSGGQKQRVSLARAIYSKATVLLLDDYSDRTVAGRTVLIVTHQVHLTLHAASLVVVLDKGTIIGAGTPEEVTKNQWIENVNLNTPVTGADGEGSEVSTLDGEEPGQGKPKKEKKAATKLTEDEKKVEGAVSFSVYKTYLIASGGWPFWTGLLALFLLRELLDISQNAWLAIWANDMTKSTGSYAIRAFDYLAPAPVTQSIYKAFAPVDKSGQYGAVTMALFGQGSPETVNVDYYLGIYILLSIIAMLAVLLTNYYTIFGGLAASRSLHEQLLHKVLRAKVRFFDTTPIGRIINRFSSDISTIDEDVSNGLEGLFGASVTILGIVVIISVNMPLFLVPAVFIVGVYTIIGSFYVPVSRDLKRLNSNSRSPILNNFNETLSGVATIRAYGFEDRFVAKNLLNQDNNNRTFLLLWSTNRWLHWRVDIAGALVAFATGFLILQNYGRIEPGWAAMSLTYSLMFTGTIVWLIRNYAQNEMNLNSVERVAEYIALEEEPPAIIPGSRPPAAWPHAGEIVIDHLTMKYSSDAPAVIKDISLTIKAGEKVGVVGRTGSGKSTLAISLFRFMDPVAGKIVIDGVDICKIGLQDLRTNLTIIPQDPILFKGTLRSNLDPFGEREDRELWEALRRSHLIPETAELVSGKSSSKSPAGSVKGAATSSSSAEATPGGSERTVTESETVDPSKITLDTPVKEHGSNFSQGQRQLIALARALVRQSKIIVMDEATASVDFETDLRIQGTIREEMSQSTIITIAHRIRTIADFDRVLVMNAGEVAEFDKPLTLMKKEDSLFRMLCERSSEFETLLAIAEEKERKDLEAGRHV
ncbi:hypothetical protein BGW38_001974 [Lunasporangiospora selenospora]|uniref:Uncharacterized protein n=1 Tax=Lunasporangiospora selenospora TaxID=979761 RepID=A0A9P6KDV1_9FUNG|nr:hypothetical protein BGW38_001974 [Lunasporangiospora selenospora]